MIMTFINQLVLRRTKLNYFKILLHETLTSSAYHAGKQIYRASRSDIFRALYIISHCHYYGPMLIFFPATFRTIYFIHCKYLSLLNQLFLK